MGFTFYKKGHGKYARWVTAISFGVILLFGCWELYEGLGAGEAQKPWEIIGVGVTRDALTAAMVFLVGMVFVAILTCGFESSIWGLRGLGARGRAFIDFLIDVEAELRKVAWPNRRELLNSTWVVIITMVVFAFFLVVMDRVLQLAMRSLGVL
ncbi:MAG: preprotein translocase subunit SecE [Planctomycetota bacterium]